MRTLKIGIAGYMGSGKSLAAQIIAAQCKENCIVIDADAYAKEFMNNSAAIKQALAHAFGAQVIRDGAIVFNVLSGIVFNAMDALQRLNAIVHPPLLNALKESATECRSDCVILDAALIPYWRIESWFDHLLWINASQEIRAERIHKREKNRPPQYQLISKMHMQERLFSIPDNDPWILIRNETHREDFEEALRTICLPLFSDSI